MAFNTVGQYTGNHKVWDHVGNLIPDVEYSEGTRPHGEYQSAAWIPVQFFEKYFENYITIMPGKVLAFDNDNRIVPAQYGLSGAQVTYLTRDVEAGTIDVRTGAALLSAATGTFDVSSVSSYLGRGEAALTVSRPVGVASYPVLQASGDQSALDDGSNPVAFRNHNYQMQHRVALLCDYVLELPQVPADTADEDLTEDTHDGGAKTSVLDAVSNLPVAKNTVGRTPITFGAGTLGDQVQRFANEVALPADITRLGDWTINLTTGVITVYNEVAFGAGNLYTISYSNYASAPTGSDVSVFASVVGNVSAGDFLICNADSNFAPAASEDFRDIMAQVLDIETQPKDALDRVKTAYNPTINTDAAGAHPGFLGQLDQMAGSATGGVTGKVHYAGAANKVVRLNLVSR